MGSRFKDKLKAVTVTNIVENTDLVALALAELLEIAESSEELPDTLVKLLAAIEADACVISSHRADPGSVN